MIHAVEKLADALKIARTLWQALLQISFRYGHSKHIMASYTNPETHPGVREDAGTLRPNGKIASHTAPSQHGSPTQLG